MASRILIFGATSAIAQAVARRYAAEGATFVLVARNREKLTATAADLVVRGAATAEIIVAKIDDCEHHQALMDAVAAKMQFTDVVLIAYGTLPNQQQCEAEPAIARSGLEINFVSVVSLTLYLAKQFERQRAGTLAVIGSVAGDRGKRSNYIYGSAKGGLAIYLQGLRDRLAACGVNVVTIKPGFVDTPMTQPFAKGMLWATPSRVAIPICRAIEKGRSVVYVPWFWRPIMLAIAAIPGRLFAKLKL